MRALRWRLALLVLGISGLVLAVVAPSYGCAPLATLSTEVEVVRPGDVVQLRGSGFSADPELGQVVIHLHAPDDMILAVVPGPSFSIAVTIPASTPPSSSGYPIVGRQFRLSDGALQVAASTMVYVTAPESIPPQPVEASVAPPGYRLVASDGGIFAFGSAGFFGSMGGKPLHRPVVGMDSTPSGNGYWEVASDGGVFAFGDAGFFGSTGGLALAQPIVGMARTPSGRGYWLVASDGGVFAFGDAGFFGSVAGVALDQPVVGLARTHTGGGYWLVGADGGVFAFGDAPFLGSVAGRGPPIVAVATSPREGYWLTDSQGAVIPFGEFWGADEPLDRGLITHPVVGMRPTGSGRDFWLASSDGGVFTAFGAPFLGSAGGLPLAAPVVGIAATRG